MCDPGDREEVGVFFSFSGELIGNAGCRGLVEFPESKQILSRKADIFYRQEKCVVIHHATDYSFKIKFNHKGTLQRIIVYSWFKLIELQ